MTWTGGRNHWNDRRSRRVFLCFYSAIFQLTSAKFQTFAYNSRTVRSSYMKFRQQFEINKFYVCTKFRGNRLHDFGFRTRKPPRKFCIKSGLRQKRLKCSKKYFIWLYAGAYLGGGVVIGPWPPFLGRQDCKIALKVSKNEAWPPPLQVGIRLWARNYLILGEKWDEI